MLVPIRSEVCSQETTHDPYDERQRELLEEADDSFGTAHGDIFAADQGFTGVTMTISRLFGNSPQGS
jgi:hypothetical protein